MSFKDQLPKDSFIQTHKSYIVSKYKVDKIIENQLIIGAYAIPISVRLKRTVLNNF
jgi:DNA-binding LytR/AlgR family response regulator